MKYCNAPILFCRNNENGSIQVARPLNEVTLVIDNWIDTVIFTAIRRFKADEDFGFSFWDNEFIAMNLTDFNNGVDYKIVTKRKGVEEREQMSSAGIKVCEQSILNSIHYYIPYLQDVSVQVSLSYEKGKISHRGQPSKYVVRVKIKGRTCYDEYSGTREGDYQKEAIFFMDPFLNNK